MEDLQKKRVKETESMNLIFDIYEKGHVEEKEEIEELRRYSAERIQKCPMMETKTYCSNCQIHCYKPVYREKIRKVMRYAGPRLLLKSPGKVFDHAIKRLFHKIRKFFGKKKWTKMREEMIFSTGINEYKTSVEWRKDDKI